MTEGLSKYDIPKGNGSPFNPSSDGNYFLFAHTYSNLGKSLDDFSMREIEKYIPMGRTTIIFCYREALIENGIVIHEWQSVDTKQIKENTYLGKYLISSDKHIDVPGRYSDENEIYSIVLNDRSMAIKEALQFSATYKCRLLISVILDTLMWH